jgi:LacI family transcriptional regulator, gluconate utilization system Gnt-I transcriptional repressor
MTMRSPSPKSATFRRKAASTAKITIREVAALADVSLMTVSRAINEPDRVAAATLTRVREAMAGTGYVPNMAAVSLRSAQSRLVVAIVPTLRTHMFDKMIAALRETLAACGYQVLLGVGDYSTQREDELLRAIVGRRPDGITVTGAMHSKATRSLLAASGIPVVETGDLIRDPIDMVVGVSHEKAAAAVCRYLADRGRHRLAIFSGNDPRALRRNKAFCREAAKLSLPSVHVVESPPPTHHALGRTLLSQLVAEGHRVDAIYCSSDMLAAGVLTEARVRRIDVPGRLAVVGTGDIELAATQAPALTTVRSDDARIGKLAAEMLINRMSGKTVVQSIVDVGFEIVERESA